MLLLEIAEEESKESNLKKSIEICSEAIKLQPSPQAYSLLANAFFKLNNKREAKDNFNHVLRLIQAKPIEQRTREDYVAAITAEIKLKELSNNTAERYSIQALNRGILTRDEIERIR